MLYIYIYIYESVRKSLVLLTVAFLFLRLAARKPLICFPPCTIMVSGAEAGSAARKPLTFFLYCVSSSRRLKTVDF